MKDFIYKKLMIYLILFQPIIDMITSYMTLNGLQITLGIITKVFILLLALVYLVFIDKDRRKLNLIVLFLLFTFGILNIYNNISILNVAFFDYFNYLFKYFYHIIILLFLIRWYKYCGIKLYQLRIPIIIILVSYFISLITDTGYLSYDIYRKGTSGWYSSANELGNLLCLLFPISIYNAFHNKDGIKLDILLCILTGLCMLLLGTKVGLVGFFGIAFGYMLIRIIFVNKYQMDKGVIIVLIMTAASLFLFTKLPAVYNIKIVSEKNNDINYLMLSGRSDFLEEIKKEYSKSSYFDRIVGKTYYGDFKGSNGIMIVEQDFYDIFFMYGYVGIGIVLISYLMVYIHFVRKFLNYYQCRRSLSKKYLTLIIAITLELCVAFISGHSLLSPSVTTYLTLLVALSFNLEFKENSSSKKNILVSINSDFYKKIDLDKYDVTLLVTNKKEERDYNLLYPYYSNKIRNNGNNKILFNRISAFLMTRNQKYDIILGDNSNSTFDNYYLYYANGKQKVLVGKSENKLFKKCILKKEINEL